MHYWYEVILADPSHKRIAKDKEIRKRVLSSGGIVEDSFVFLMFVLSAVMILPVYGIDLSELENVGLKYNYIINFWRIQF